MTDCIHQRRGQVGRVVWAVVLLLAGCPDSGTPPTVAALARPVDVAFVCMEQKDGTRQFYVHPEECDSCSCTELLAFVSQSARDEVGIVRLDGPNSDEEGPIDVDQRIPLYTGVPVAPRGHLPGAIVAVAALGYVFVANKGSDYLTAIPFNAAFETEPEVHHIKLNDSAEALVVSSREGVTRLYAAQPATGQIAVVELDNELWPPDEELPEGVPVPGQHIDYLDLGAALGESCPADSVPPGAGDAGPDLPDGSTGDAAFVDSDGLADGGVTDGAPPDASLGDGAPADSGLGDAGPAEAGAGTPKANGTPQPADLVLQVESDGEEILYVALSDRPCIALVRPDALPADGRISSFSSGRPTKRLALVPEADGREFGGALLAERGGPWLYALDAERSGVLVYNLATETMHDLRDNNPLVDYPGIPIPGVAREVTVVEHYPEICANGVDDNGDGTADEDPCQEDGAKWSESFPWGVFALVSSANGNVYVITVQDEWESPSDQTVRCVRRDPDRTYLEQRPGCQRHQFRSETDVTIELPHPAQVPILTTSEAEVPLEFNAVNDGPRFVPEDEGATEPYEDARHVPVPDGNTAPQGDDDQAVTHPSHGIFFDWEHPSWSRGETWTMVFEGVLPGSQRSSGAVVDPPGDGEQADFNDERGISFCAVGVKPGDLLVITSSPALDRQACEADYLRDGVYTPLTYRIDQVVNRWLLISKRADTDPPLPRKDCFGEAVTYEIRASQWLLRGDATGYLHRQTVDPQAADSEYALCVEPPLTCPPVTCHRGAVGSAADEFSVRRRRNLDSEETDTRCLLNGRVSSGLDFANPFFCFNFVEGDPVRDDQVSWIVADGFRRRVIEAGETPSRLRYNEWDQSLYVVDNSKLGLLRVSLDALAAAGNYQ